TPPNSHPNPRHRREGMRLRSTQRSPRTSKIPALEDFWVDCSEKAITVVATEDIAADITDIDVLTRSG
ncbi:hypothetical protein, partial [Mycobacterium intracellulare]|uniref:hypothetical protein n=1 Tax=Mycobacterium intracellulare TaxID=1767 RepID=UPI000B1E055B